MTVTLIIEKKRHVGNYTIPFIEGVYDAILTKYETDTTYGKRYMKVTGIDFNYDIEVGVGTCPVALVPNFDYLNLTKEALEEYVSNFTEMDYDELNIKRYIQTVTISKVEVGGYERDRSYATIITSDNLDTFDGYKKGASWINMSVDYKPIIDTQDLVMINQ